MDQNRTCIECGTPLQYKEAGISKKTNRPYNGFFFCPNGHQQPRVSHQAQQPAPYPSAPTATITPGIVTPGTMYTPAPQAAPPNQPWQPKERDYDGENRGKIRHGLIAAAIEHDGLREFSNEELQLILKLTEFIFTGSLEELWPGEE